MRKVITLSAILLFILTFSLTAQNTFQLSQVNPKKTGPSFFENHVHDHSDVKGVFVTNFPNNGPFIPAERDAMNQYTVAYTTGISFSSITGTGNTYPGWRNAVSTDDNMSTATPIGFTFVYNGIPYTTFSVSTNGFFTLNAATAAIGSGIGAYGYDNTQFTSTTGTLATIAGFYDDLVTPGNPGTLAGLNAALHYLTTGVAPNRILTAEWTGMEQFNVPGPNLNWQVKLYEVDGHIELVYGTMDPTSGSFTYSLGINAQTLSAVPTAAELLEQQTNNTNTFNNTIQNAQTIVPATNTQLTFSTPAAPNGSPSGLGFSLTGTTSTTLTWNDNSTNELGFPIYRSTDNVNFSYVGSGAASGGSTQTALVSGLSPNTTYFFRVYASTEGQLSASFTNGQVTTLATTPICGTKSIGPTGNYLTITAAIADIAASGMCGATILELQPTYVSTTETFPLSFSTISGLLSATNTLTVRPQTGATNRVITSANTTATVDLNGCTYVTFDGRQGGVGAALDLKLDNTSTSGAVVRFINSASNCTLKYCTVTGVCTSTVSGDIFFSTTTGVTQGNNNNVIDNCDIKDGATQPVNLIYSSGTTSVGLFNSNNTVSNCLLSNFFSAGSVTNGIFLTSGNTAWTITGNRIFQTASRTYTTGNIHDAITITSSTGAAGGFTINNNIIGYATSAGTGTYTMLGTLANRFICINVTQSITGPVSNIQGNTMTNFSLASSSGATTTNGVWCGISLQSGDFNVGTTAANFIGDASTNNAISTTITTGGGLTVGINDASTGNVNISNNTIGSITAVGTTVSITPAITAIQVTSGIPTITNNTIGSPSIANSINTGALAYTNILAGTVLGINVTTVTGSTTINNNSIRNLTNTGTSTSHATRGIIYSSTSPVTINNNTITNLSCAGSTAGVTGLANVNGIIVNGAALGGCTVRGNTIFTLNSTNAGLFATGTVGIAVSNPANIDVSLNKIYDLRNASTMVTATTPPVCAGIQFRAGPDSARVYNNMISLGNSQTTNTEFIGILNNFSTVAILKSSFNTINIEGTATAGALPSFCFYRGDFGVASAILTPVILYNNLFNNTRSGGTGKHYAIGNQQTSASTGWVASNVNNNVLNSALATTVGLWSVTDQSFTQWKTSSLGDASSLSGVAVTFSASATGDLHMNMGVTPTAIESGGIAYAGITTDFDGQVRPGPAGSINGGATAPDIGADEFDGAPTDIIAPTITYTVLGSGPASGTRSFTNVIATDISGINITSGTKPRCYYKKSGDLNDNTGWKFVEANGTTSPFDFTINYALLNAGSVSVGDVIQYFVVAQDNAGTPNVAINSGIFNSQPSSVNLAAGNYPITGTINQYSITANIYSGNYTIGTLGGESFSSFTNAGGFFDALNNGAISGNVNLSVTSDIGTETGAVTLNPIAEDGPGGYTVTITPQTAALKTISGTPAGTSALIKLNGVKRVTIDGRWRGSGPSYITFANTNVTAGTGGEAFLINNGTSNILLEYLTIKGNSQNLGAFVGGTIIGIYGTTGSVGNNNITIDNCNISNFTGSNPYIGIGIWGQSQSINNSTINITNNNIFDWGVNSAAANCMGMWITNSSSVTISGNSFYRTASLTAAALNDFIIQTASGTGPGLTITGNYFGGTAPLCGGTAFTTTTSSSMYIIDINDISLHTTTSVVANNTIKNFSFTSSNATTGTITFCGVFNRGGAGACTISGNQIGDNTVDATVSPSILHSNTSTVTHALEPIDSRSGNGAITNNNVGGLRTIRTSTGITNMNLIFSGTQGTKNITGNLVGSLSTSENRPNKLSQDEIEALKKLPNYPDGETAPKNSSNRYITANKFGGITVLTAINDEKANESDDAYAKINESKMSEEKSKIENNKKNINLTELMTKDIPLNNLNKNSINNNATNNKVNEKDATNLQNGKTPRKDKGDSPLATISNISQETPSQIVPIFSSGFGGTVSNNTIANIGFNGGAGAAGVLNSINVSNASSPSQNIVVTNNTIRNITHAGNLTATHSGIIVTTTYPGTFTCTGNTVSTILMAPTLAFSVGFVGISSSGTGFQVISGNTVTDVSCGPNITSGAYSGIVAAVTAPATLSLTSNIIQNFTLNSAASSTHSFNGISASGTGDFNISSNTVNNVVSNSNLTLSTSGANVFSGLFLTLTSATNSSSVNTVNANTITNATCNPFTAATSIKLQGIFQSASGSSYNITKNYVTGLLTNSTATTTMINGFNSFLGNRITMSNNIFDIGNGITTDNTVIAVYDDSVGPLEYFYNNTWRVRGTVAAGTTNTAIFFRNTTSSAITEMKNNLMSNERTGGTGSHMVINNNSNGATNWNISDYNDYYSANPNTIGRWLATDLNLATWKSTSAKDTRTFSSLASFTGTDRINASDLSVSGRGTFVASVTTDIDGDARPTAMSTTVKPVDVGADQYIPSGFSGIGNSCLLNGTVYQDGGMNSVEIVSGTFGVTSVKEYTGVRSPFNTMGKPLNGNGNNNNTRKIKDGRSGGEEMLVPVNEPWIYWELPGYTPSSDVVLRFYYNPEMLATINENNLRVTYWNGSAWENSFIPQSINTSSHYIQVTLPQSYSWNPTSHFAIEDNTSPLPVDICSFTNSVLNRDINLAWTTCQEVNNRGFNVERRLLIDEKTNRYSDWVSLGFVPGNGTSNEQHTYSYSDKKLFTGKYEYRLKQMDFNSNSEYFALNKLVEIGRPNNADVSQNYPNPSNPKSKIDFQIPFDSKVSLKVYDELGKEVAIIMDESKIAGFYTAEFDGSNMASGVYFYRLIADGSGQKFTKTMKMILVK